MTPWQDRQQTGFFNAVVETVKQVLFRPGTLFESLDMPYAYGEALVFSMILSAVFILVSLPVSFAFNTLILHQAMPNAPALLFSAGMIVVLAVAFVPVGLFVGSGILHLLVMLMGGQGGFKGTFNVLAYNTATSIWSVIPVVGGVISYIWGAVTGIIGLKRVHNLSTAKAAIAWLIPTVALLIIVALAIGSAAFLQGGAASRAAAPVSVYDAEKEDIAGEDVEDSVFSDTAEVSADTAAQDQGVPEERADTVIPEEASVSSGGEQVVE